MPIIETLPREIQRKIARNIVNEGRYCMVGFDDRSPEIRMFEEGMTASRWEQMIYRIFSDRMDAAGIRRIYDTLKNGLEPESDDDNEDVSESDN